MAFSVRVRNHQNCGGAGLGDLERALARLQASTLAEGDGTNAAIYYEDTAKRKVLSLITALRGLQSVQVKTLLCCLPRFTLTCLGFMCY